MRKILSALVLSLFLYNAFPTLALAADLPVATLQTYVGVTATTTAAQALPYQAGRKYLLIQNKGAVQVVLTWNGAGSGTEGIAIPAGGSWEPVVIPVNSLWVKSASSTADVGFTYGL